MIYTPAYDIVTTQAYPRFATNPPALSVDGRKTWAPGASLERFFNARLGIAPKRYREMVEQLCDSAIAVGKEMVGAAKNETRWHGDPATPSTRDLAGGAHRRRTESGDRHAARRFAAPGGKGTQRCAQILQ